MSNEFTLGQCKGCGKTTGLKNGRCAKCQEPSEDMFKDLFGSDFGDLLNKYKRKDK